MKTESLQPWMAIHPGEILKDELTARGISLERFCEMTGINCTRGRDILNGRKPVTRSFADLTEKALGIPALSLLIMQELYEHDMKVINMNKCEKILI